MAKPNKPFCIGGDQVEVFFLFNYSYPLSSEVTVGVAE